MNCEREYWVEDHCQLFLRFPQTIQLSILNSLLQFSLERHSILSLSDLLQLLLYLPYLIPFTSILSKLRGLSKISPSSGIETPFYKNLDYRTIFVMSIENGWFYESETMWEGLELLLTVTCRTAFWSKSKGSIVS